MLGIFYFAILLFVFCEKLPEPAFTAVIIASIVLFFLHIILLTSAVVKNASSNKIGAKRIWGVLTFAIGIPGALFYAIFTHKARKVKSTKSNINIAVLSFASLFLCAILFCTVSFIDSNENIAFFSDYDVTYVNDNGDKVIYDKIGNEYTAVQKNEILYYDKNGNSYVAYSDSEYDGESSFDADGYMCIESNEKYSFSDEVQCYIDQNGYINILNTDELNYSDIGVYYDDDKNIYYEVYLCYWTPDGELTFSDTNEILKD